jgi:hypothetical protein
MFPPLGRYRCLAAGRHAGFSHIGAPFLAVVLIVEHEVTIHHSLIELLGEDERQIVTAGDGQEANEAHGKDLMPTRDSARPDDAVNGWLGILEALVGRFVDCQYSLHCIVRLHVAS